MNLLSIPRFGSGGGAVCGNGIIETAAGEQCDDRNTANGDGCSSTCQIESGWTCTGEPSVCVNQCLSIVRCSDYTTQASCNPDACNVAPTCPAGFTNPRCLWDNSLCRDACDLIGTGNVSTGTCLYTSQPTNDTCDDGFLSFSWTATWRYANGTIGSNPNCQPGSRTVECPAQVALPFFSFYNILAAILVIAAIYWAMHLRKTRKGKKK